MRFGKFWAAVGVALAAYWLVPAAAETAASEIIKSPNDTREYRYFTLANGLRAVAVSDPDTDKAAASLDVNVGSGADPEGREGLAHFLEHLLFLGTEKYPESGEYKAFIASHGGSDNAYTALEHTNYYFDVDKDSLEPALDRFAQFFIAPLFTERYVDRERQVVHSEYQSKLRSDGWRTRSAQRLVANPAHPFSRFNVGSADTLADRDGTGSSVRDELIAFYQNHYSADRMTLALLGREPLDQLQRWAEEKFSAVPRRDTLPYRVDVPLFEPGRLPLRLDVVPVKDSRSLTLTFPVPPLKAHYRAKPLRYIGNLLGHEGEGSLLSLLKSRGWVDSLWAGAMADNISDALFGVSMELTRSGLEQVDQVTAQVFQYLRLIDSVGIERWRFDEQRQLAEVAFQFQEPLGALQTVRALAATLHDYPVAELLRGGYVMDDYDPALIRAYLAELRPDNVLMTVTAPELAELADARDPWFGTPYRVSPIPPDTLAVWDNASPDPALALAVPNEFIAEHLALKPEATAGAKPELIRSARGFEFWHQQDDTYRVPKAELYFSVRSPLANDSPRNAMLTRLLVALANDQLAEFTYPAYLAGLDYQLYKHLRGFSVRISGYDEQQGRLLGRILDTLTGLEVSEQRFRAVKNELRRDLKNAAQEAPYRQAYQEAVDLLMVPSWSNAASLAALEPLTADDLRRFAPQLLGRLSLAGLAYGNVDRGQALVLAGTLHERLLAPAEAVEVGRGQAVELDAGDRRRRLDLEHNDSALLVYVQGHSKSLASRASFALLGQLLGTPFFDDLRTEHKLGYIVSAGPLPILEVPGLAFVVQSPSADPVELEGHVERFLTDYEQTLAAMPAAEFARNQLSLTNQILRREKTLQDRAGRYWTEIDRQETDFASRERLAAAVGELRQKDLLRDYRALLLGPERRRLIVSSVGQRHAEAYLAKLAGRSRAGLIDDPARFKQNRPLFAD